GPPTGRLTRPRPRGTRPRLVTDGRGRLTPPTGYCCQRLKRAPPPPGVRRLARELTKAAKVITQRIGDSRRIDCLATAQAVKCSLPESPHARGSVECASSDGPCGRHLGLPAGYPPAGGPDREFAVPVPRFRLCGCSRYRAACPNRDRRPMAPCSQASLEDEHLQCPRWPRGVDRGPGPPRSHLPGSALLGTASVLLRRKLQGRGYPLGRAPQRSGGELRLR